MKRGNFAYRLGAFDQFINSLIGHGSRDQTFSARVYEGRVAGIWWCGYAEDIINGIFFWQDEHCKTSFFTDETELTYQEYKD